MSPDYFFEYILTNGEGNVSISETDRESFHMSEESLFQSTVKQLRDAGLLAEAGSLYTRHRELHESFSVLDNAFNILKYYFWNLSWES